MLFLFVLILPTTSLLVGYLTIIQRSGSKIVVDICRQQMETMRKRLRGQKLYHNNNNTEFIEHFF